MTDAWWFPLAFALCLWVGIVLLAAGTNYVFKRMSPQTQGLVGGALILAVIAYVVIAFGFAILSPSTSSNRYEDDVEREFPR